MVSINQSRELDNIYGNLWILWIRLKLIAQSPDKSNINIINTLIIECYMDRQGYKNNHTKNEVPKRLTT